MRERYVEIVVGTPAGQKAIYRGRTTAQAYSACANNCIGRNAAGQRLYKGFTARVVECVTSRKKALGWFGMEV